jgi:hypothetical protein
LKEINAAILAEMLAVNARLFAATIAAMAT